MALVVAGVGLAVLIIVAALQTQGGVRGALRPVEEAPSRSARPLVLFVGDGVVAGVGVRRSEAWPRLASEELGWDDLNEGSAGTGFSRSLTGSDAVKACGRTRCPAFDEAARRVAWRKVDLIVVSGGRADAAVPTAEESLAIDAFVVDVRSMFPGVPIVATNPLWDDTIPPAALDSMATRLRENDDIRYLALGQPLQFRPDLVAADGTNPNAAGQRIIAEGFVRAFRAAP